MSKTPSRMAALSQQERVSPSGPTSWRTYALMATMDFSRLNLTSPPKDNSEASLAQSCLNTLRRHCRECYAQWDGHTRRDREILPLHSVQGFGSRAQDDNSGLCPPLLFLYISHIIYLD